MRVEAFRCNSYGPLNVQLFYNTNPTQICTSTDQSCSMTQTCTIDVNLVCNLIATASVSNFPDEWWTFPWGPCNNTTCIQSRSLECVSCGIQGLHDCDASSKPETTQTCDTTACIPVVSYLWEVTSGPCSVSCGSGTEIQYVGCFTQDGGTSVADSYCNPTTKPAIPSPISCTQPPCVPPAPPTPEPDPPAPTPPVLMFRRRIWLFLSGGSFVLVLEVV
jgi:hypothetical protein